MLVSKHRQDRKVNFHVTFVIYVYTLTAIYPLLSWLQLKAGGGDKFVIHVTADKEKNNNT